MGPDDGFIGPVLLCSTSPFCKGACSGGMIRWSCENPASWIVPPPFKWAFGRPSLCRSGWSELCRSYFLLLLFRSSVLSGRLLLPFPSGSVPVELLSLEAGAPSFNPFLCAGQVTFPPPSPFLGRCWCGPLNSVCCGGSLDRVNVVADEGKLCPSKTSLLSLWGFSDVPRAHLSWPFPCWPWAGPEDGVQLRDPGSWPGFGKSASL